MGCLRSRRWLMITAASFSVLTFTTAATAVDFPPPPPGQGGPSRTAGGGVRAGEGCVAKGSTITPIAVVAPVNNIVTTVAESPALYVYLPRNTAPALELAIFGPGGSEYYRQLEIPAPISAAMAAGPTLLKIQPENLELEPEQLYEWSFSLLCDPDDPAGYIEGVDSTVRRLAVNASLASALAGATSSLAKAEAYAAAGIWSETAALALDLRAERPEEWQQLVRSTIDPTMAQDVATVNLQDLFHAPLQTLTLELETR